MSSIPRGSRFSRNWYGNRDEADNEAGRDKRQPVPPRPIIGLARNPKGIAFRCGTCKWMGQESKCANPQRELNGQPVDAHRDCCDYYDHAGMKVIIK